MNNETDVQVPVCRTWCFVDPENVVYPEVQEEDGYDSDDDFMFRDDALKLRPKPLIAKTAFVPEENIDGRIFERMIRIPHCYRSSSFVVDMILGTYHFENGKSDVMLKYPPKEEDFFITGYHLNIPEPSSPEIEKRAWFSNLLTRASDDYQELTLFRLRKRHGNRSGEILDESKKLRELCEKVVDEFIEFLDFEHLWGKRNWLREGLMGPAMLLRSTFATTLNRKALACGVMTLFNGSLTVKAVMCSLDAYFVFRYMPVFHPRRIENMLRHWVSLKVKLQSSDKDVSQEMIENFETLWRFDGWDPRDERLWPPDEDAQTAVAEICVSQQLKKMNEAVVSRGKIVFGFADLMPFGLEAKYVDFLRSEIFRQFGTLEACKYKVYAKLRDRCEKSGNTYIKEGYLRFFFKEILTIEEWNQVIAWLAENGIIFIERRPFVSSERLFMLKEFYDAEWDIAKGILSLLVKYPYGNRMINVTPDDPGFRMFQNDADQVQAIHAFCSHPLIVLNGRAGSGKTQVVSAYITAALNKLRPNPSRRDEESSQRMDVLLTAPTGKAASVLEKRIKVSAFTLHSVLHAIKKNGPGVFSHVKIWVVDECSMVPLTIFNQVFQELLECSQLCKVILIGDRLQLPSVDPGNFLGDIYDGLKTRKPDLCVDLRTNHRSESEIIVNNAQCVIERRNDQIDLSDDRFRILDLEPFTCFSSPWDANLGLTDQKTSQIITFLNTKVQVYNDAARIYYRKGDAPEFSSARGFRPEPVFERGDKVICQKNADVRLLVESRGEQVLRPKRMSNGCQFVIIEDAQISMRGVRVEAGDEMTNQDDPVSVRGMTRFLKLDDLGGEVIMAHYGDIVKKAKLRLAWALTVHKFQGSETDHVSYALTGNQYETCQVVYTAVTRGRKSVTLIGTRSQLAEAINRPARKRETSLKERIYAVLSPDSVASQMSIQSSIDSSLSASASDVMEEDIQSELDAEIDVFSVD